VRKPETRIGDFEILTKAERERLLVEWNDTAAEYRGDRCLHELFAEQAARTPDEIAVVFETGQLTYGELNERANQLAHYLQQRGVGPEVLVGLCVQRSWEMVVGLLGILKAGGAYVPLDPAYPAERLRFMLEDSSARLLLTQQPLLPVIPESTAAVVCLDRDWSEIGKRSGQNPETSAAAENLAYVIYTSGSTGKPKGVAIEHHSAAALLSWARGVFSQEELSGVLASTSICFDLSVFELFVPLSYGGKVLLVEDVLQLMSWPRAAEVKLINTVPSAMVELLRLGGLPESVRTVNLAGEPLAASLVEELYQQPQIKRVFDLYGPSEDTTYSTWALRLPAGPATIGRPVANTRIYLLDANQQLVPIGVPGELYLGGAGLARGYLQRPQLTAKAFIPDPFGLQGNGRLYKTGDLARYLADGNIEYLGRLDNQVKLRGFRIELAEIEGNLLIHPQIHQAVVIASGTEHGDQQLVAYIVAAGEAPADNELRAHLRRNLPDYMIPSAFVLLEALPLTSSGKVNRLALPRPTGAQLAIGKDFVAPRTDAEKQLAIIWIEVLKRDRVGVNDNFFEIGGHSLLATQVISRVRKRFQVEMPLRTMFEAPTVASLAAVLEVQQKVKPASAPTLRRQRSSAKVEQLSSEEVDNLLATVLSSADPM
jgi:amino acid adenylation domain-containing protein